jgi:hypothetical protein
VEVDSGRTSLQSRPNPCCSGGRRRPPGARLLLTADCSLLAVERVQRPRGVVTDPPPPPSQLQGRPPPVHQRALPLIASRAPCSDLRSRKLRLRRRASPVGACVMPAPRRSAHRQTDSPRGGVHSSYNMIPLNALASHHSSDYPWDSAQHADNRVTLKPV